MARETGAPSDVDSRVSSRPAIVSASAPVGPPLGVVSRPAGYRMITSVEIENFRPFKKLELSDLQRVNIIVGDNGSGKTALMEGMFLASAANPQLPITLRQWRGMEALPNTLVSDLYDSLWNSMFNEFDKNRIIRIDLHGSDNDSRSLLMHFEKEAAVTLPLKQNGGTGGEAKPSTGIYRPFVFHWKSPDGPDSIITMILGSGGLQAQGFARESNIRTAFIPAHAQTSNHYTATLFSNLSKQNKEGDFITALTKQFSFIQKVSVELETGASAIFISVPWLNEKISLSLFSNAAANLASIILNIAASTRGAVFVDEIENGFHFSRYKLMWEQAYNFAGQYQTQLFASTHSLECLKAAIPLIGEHPGDFTLIQMFQDDGVSSARVIAGEDALNAIEHGLEVRQ